MSKMSPQKKENAAIRLEEWLLEHEYGITFTGSSPVMEPEGAAVLWSRSIERHNLRYKWMVN